jgi:hypothetical protein
LDPVVGATYREQWIDSTKKGESEPWEWVPKDPPHQLEYLWNWFLELHTGRHFDANGPKPISYQDMYSWSRLTERKLGQFELKIIRQMDRRYFYVLRTPDSTTSDKIEDGAKKAEHLVAQALRGMIAPKKKETPGLGALAVPVSGKRKNG